MKVHVAQCDTYDTERIAAALEGWNDLFDKTIHPGDTVVLKPNWLAPSHKFKPDEWRCVITNPELITAVLKMVLNRLQGRGHVVLTDGPQTDSSWQGIMDRMDPQVWRDMGNEAGIDVEIIDLRDDEWLTRGDVNVERRKLPGDPRGSTVCDLAGRSEFASHQPSKRGYYGADYDPAETNAMHSGGVNKYKVSRTVIEADVFINLPKMKTHKKAGITCSLKNLVGINTYKNWLPHHSEGTPDEGGDAFPQASVKNKLETSALSKFKSLLMRYPALGKWMIPVKALGKRFFGDTQEVIRSGNWYGNDTLWRMVLDLNKILFFANPDGTLRDDDPMTRKRYISIVDGIVAGEGNGPEAPNSRPTGVIVGGSNPVAVDAVCARIMGFDWQAIPCIRQSFAMKHFSLVDFGYEDICVDGGSTATEVPLTDYVPGAPGPAFKPHFGWLGHVELDRKAATLNV